jgi:hypothetical protein
VTPLDRLTGRLAYLLILLAILIATMLTAAAVLAAWLGAPPPVHLLAVAIAGTLPRALVVTWARRRAG